MVDEEYWCMQWCGEVLPEADMVPDLGVFLRTAPASSQAVTARQQSHAPPRHLLAEAEAEAEARAPFPARLKLPFLLSPEKENKNKMF